MSNLPKKFLETTSAELLFWHSCVDDILLYLTGNETDLQNTLSHLNKIHQKILITVETEFNSRLNFLLF